MSHVTKSKTGVSYIAKVLMSNSRNGRVALSNLVVKTSGQLVVNAHWADPCTEGAPIVRQDLSGRPAM